MYFHIITSAFYLPRQKMLKFEGWNQVSIFSLHKIRSDVNHKQRVHHLLSTMLVETGNTLAAFSLSWRVQGWGDSEWDYAQEH